jgi:hypothetical protein
MLDQPDNIADRVEHLEAEVAELRDEIAQLRRLVLANARPERVDEDLPVLPPGGWVPLKEAAYRVGKSLAWVYLHRKRGAIPELPVGGRVLVDARAAIAAACRSAEGAPPSAA